jgi:hypothetical protein
VSTTALIVEVVIIGAQVLVWMGLAAIALFDVKLPDLQTLKEWTAPVSLSLIALSYTVGMIFDTMVASFFAPWTMRSRRVPWGAHRFPASPARMRVYVMVNHHEASQYLERQFNQSRLLRATVLNLLLIGVFSTVLYFRYSGFSWRGLTGTLFFLVFLTGATFFSWRRALQGYYYTLEQIFELIANNEKAREENVGADGLNAPHNPAAPADQKAPLPGR